MLPKNLKRYTFVKTSLRLLKNTSEHLSIDETDKKILRLVTADSRLSYREISRHLGLSTNTVIQRIGKLTANGVIKSYSADIDMKKLGYELTAIIELIAPKFIARKVLDELSASPNVFGIYYTTGNIDMVIIAKFRNIDEMNTFLNGLHAKLGDIRTETKIVFNTVKEDFKPTIV
ncbi:MAG: Lrp/AsnC family transcriptional regulator [Candidatus Aenigmarchaeota archaeon]|nr:Lrp/AsnC family transcriptional regulator [Candidatus Aenigmarchaeota archaeon]